MSSSTSSTTNAPYALSRYEIQSGLTRVKYAESLILQLRPDHDGRTSWLLNYGTGDVAQLYRTKRGLVFDDLTQSAATFGSNNKDEIVASQSVSTAPPVDNINPAHYRSHPSGIECIDVTRWMNFNLGNAVKYIWRCTLKHGTLAGQLEDLKKAVWYLSDEIERLEGLPKAQMKWADEQISTQQPEKK